MTKDEALKMALDFIIESNSSSQFWLVPASNLNKTVTAIREALAQQEEPLHPVHIGVDVTKEGTAVTAFYRKPDAVMEMFYSQFHPLAQPEQEPVAWEQFYPDMGKPKLTAQPEQEPVAWELRHGKTDRVLIEITNDPRRAHNWKASLEEVVPLYTKPTVVNKSLTVEQEPVATVTSESGNPNISMSWRHEPALPVGTKLYTTPPQPEPEQEPHSWYSKQEDEWMTHKTRMEHEQLNSYTHKVGKFDLALYTTPPQRKPLTDERLELIGHADLTINNIYVFSGYGEEVPEGRTPIYAGYKSAHGIKE